MSVRVLRQGRGVLRIEARQGFWFWASVIAAVVLGGGLWNKWPELDEPSMIGIGVTLAGFLGAAWFYSERRIVLLDRGIGQAVVECRRLPWAARRRSYPLKQIAAVRREWGPAEGNEPRTSRPVLVFGSAARTVVPLIAGFESRADDFAGVIAEIEAFLAE